MARSEILMRDELGHVLALLTPANALACEVAAHTGLRIGDVLAMRTEKLGQRMTIREAKTGKSRRVHIPAALLHRLKAQAGPTWVFTGARSDDKHRTRQAVWADVKRASRALRLPQNVSPHSLRKYYASELYAKCGDLGKVQKALNHDSQSVTMIYALAARLYLDRYGGGDE